ncbi:histidinol-phosphate transaminase [Denitromonas ohlonensis]|uniref:Histidinol-phosphate aminotransferase n=2 Tax=Denitromonas TaxID=139331 RepID=A0A557R226_9RHOO|nr:histidinol-phosphate transaminase [Denitromonas ohlonensis]TVT50466.1 MAG: histidinol-phosphate transaminase [Denitromonas halophila]TVO59213.1 histidinol-phosphate transaminase [Denitromonas ohlonensis]TVO73396.1 histidinol-phosphate transaminase [Denitromonas ohlonensis]TVT72825.1 MAG: histidinol-phosphate transaminase [Denitromonas halophila]TVT74647.1 MAG: histidinol-phosphate transaminase [Denitromonas halophila]
MPIADRAPDYIRAISPYQPGKPISELAREMGLVEASIVKLASNENPLGISPMAKEAIARALLELARYPDGNGFALKAALSERTGVPMSGIVLGNGSNDVLELVARTFLTPGSEAVFSEHAFAVYPLATMAVGGKPVAVPAKDFGHDLDAMAAAVTDKTGVIFIANPNNPTGTFLPGPQIEAFLEKIPERVLVVLDEAYTEYLSDDDRYDAIGWLARFPNLLVSRTFSKAYGLAGLRVGYGLAHPSVIDLLNRVRQPFNVNSLALAAATAALADEEFLAKSAALNRRGMAQLTDAFRAMSLEWIPSWGNFVTVKVGDGDAINRKLLAQGVIVRPIAGYGMPQWLRVSIGLPEENARFISALQQALS